MKRACVLAAALAAPAAAESIVMDNSGAAPASAVVRGSIEVGFGVCFAVQMSKLLGQFETVKRRWAKRIPL
jgi:hypothetical protein